MTIQPPTSTLRAVLEAPPGAATLLLIRHADRGPLPPGDPGNHLPLLPDGVQRARALGRAIGARLGVVRSSPLPRCLQTATAIAEGAARAVPIQPDPLLGDPGVYVEDAETAWEQWRTIGHERVVERIVAGVRLPGLADPVPASRRLCAHLVATVAGQAGVHAFVTHDLLVTAAAAHGLGLPLGRADWPDFLEALVLVVSGDAVTATYREWSGPLRGFRRTTDTRGG